MVPAPQIIVMPLVRDAREQIVVSLENPGHYSLSPFLTVPLRGVYVSVNGGFLDKVACPSWCNDRCVWSRQCRKLFGGPQFSLDMVLFVPIVQRQLSLLVGVQYVDKLLMYSCDAVAGSLHGALLRDAWLGSEYMFCDSSWVRWPYCSYFLHEGELGS